VFAVKAYRGRRLRRIGKSLGVNPT
jgi:hypothetical protein